MPTKKPISTAERRYHDYLRRKTLKVGAVYQARLAKSRRKELRRVLDMARDVGDPSGIAPLLESQLNESGYLPQWWTGLWTEVGVPAAKSTARSLREAKAAGEEDVWLRTLRTYATTRAGNEIVSVSGTWKDSLVSLLRSIMDENAYQGIEAITKKLYDGYVGNLEKWQCRRIAQTEAMIGMADAGAMAAETLDIPFTKQWVISGLGNTRESHEMMDGVIVDQDEPFVLPGGLMMYPHDTSMGAAAGEIINCACDVLRRPKDFTPAPEPTKDEEREERINKFMKSMPDDWTDELKRAKAENYLDIEDVLGIKKGAMMSIEKADKTSANPKNEPYLIEDPKGRYVIGGIHYSKNPKYRGDHPFSINCATCVPTYVLRRWGFDVRALGRVRRSGTLTDKAATQYFSMWKNADGTKAEASMLRSWMTKKNYKAMTKDRYKEFFAEQCQENGTYALAVSWKGGGGHMTILEKQKGKILARVEPQSYTRGQGTILSLDKLCEKLSPKPTGDGVMRVDNKLFDTSWAGLFDK